MLDISKVLNRAWHILWKYRILWVLGFFLAMAAGSGGSSSNFNWRQNMNQSARQWDWNPKSWGPILGQSGDNLVNLLIVCGVILLVLILVSSVVTAFLKYVSEAATIRAVNDYENTGIKAGFKQIWKTGWNVSAWRLFLIRLLFFLPFLLELVMIALLAVWIALAVKDGSQGFLIFSGITAGGLALLMFVFFIALKIVLDVIYHFAARISVLEGVGVIDSIKQGYAFLRRHLKSVFFMWLVMIGIGIAWFIAMVILILPLLILALCLFLPAILAGGIPGLIATGLAALFQMPSPWFWIVGGLVALPLFFLVISIPSLVVSGWQLIFNSSVWTETYRELKALETVKPAVILPPGPSKPAPRPRQVVVKPVAAKPVVKAKKPIAKATKPAVKATRPATKVVRTAKPAARTAKPKPKTTAK